MYGLQMRLLELIEKENIILDETNHLPENTLGMYIKDPNIKHPIIAIARNLRTCEYNSALAEELGHHFTSVGTSIALFNHYSKRIILNKAETAAMRWATEFALPVTYISKAIDNNKGGTTYDISNELGVTLEFFMHRLHFLSLSNQYIGINEDCEVYISCCPSKFVYAEI